MTVREYLSGLVLTNCFLRRELDPIFWQCDTLDNWNRNMAAVKRGRSIFSVTAYVDGGTEPVLKFVSACQIKGFESRLLTIIPIIGSVRGAFQILGISEGK